MAEKICSYCQKIFKTYAKDAVNCSKQCNGKSNGYKVGHPSSNTGRTQFKKGHIPTKRMREMAGKLGRIRMREKPVRNTGRTHFKKGPDNARWKGGQFADKKGYIHVLNPTHPRANSYGYVKRANLVMEEKIGRMINPGEIVHHLNEVKNDDRPENLYLFLNNAEHMRFHRLSESST